MRIKIGILLITVLAGLNVLGQKCEYRTDGPKELGTSHMVVQYKSRTIRVVKGTIVDVNDEPVTAATVLLSLVNNKEKVFIGATDSRDDGSFCFGRMPDGEYLLEVSGDGFNKAKVPLKVRSRAATEDLKTVSLEVGT